MITEKKRKKLKPFMRLILPLAAVLTASCSLLLASSSLGAAAKELFWESELPDFILMAELNAKATRAEPPEPEPEPEADTPSAPDNASGSEPEKGSAGGNKNIVLPQKPIADGGQKPAGSESAGSESAALSAENIEIKNKTEYTPDLDALLNSDLDFTGVTVLIIHSHATEAYMPDGENQYVASDPFRTLNTDQNVIRVGEELKKVLEARGITVIHDVGLYDYPNYNVSYTRALAGIKEEMAKYPEIGIVIDLHRDALEGKDGTVYKTVADVGDKPCAQVGFVVGTNFSGLDHPNWEKNLAFALKIQYDMGEKYPSLARPIKLSQYRYNQHMTEGSLIVEVGCTGNTIEEALAAVRYFGDCLADVIG